MGLVCGMAVPTLTAILKKILKQPTAPFHEYHVLSEIEALLKDCPNVKLKRDKYGNLIATYKLGKKRSTPTWVLAAHMDHPGFVRPVDGRTGKDDWEFLGGVKEEIVAKGVKKGLRKPVKGGQIATWNFPVTIDKERISGPACDDLIGCSAIVSTFWELARLKLEAKVHAVFTRAEEVGWLGAWALGEHWPFEDDAVFLSLETSRPVNGAEFGAGPIVRVGDRLSVFDSEAIDAIMRTALEQGIRVQRCLLDAGACEATALQALGYRSAGISVPLGNYHNVGEDKTIQPEYVMLEDVKSLVHLLTALSCSKQEGNGAQAIHERMKGRITDNAAHLEAGSKGFGKKSK
jgi:putative aminopeptidase FrvX